MTTELIREPTTSSGWGKWLGLAALAGALVALVLGAGAIGATRSVGEHQDEQDRILADLSAEGLGVSEGELTTTVLTEAELDGLRSVLKQARATPDVEMGALALYGAEAFVPAKRKEFVGLPEEEQLLKDPAAWETATRQALARVQALEPDLDRALEGPIAFPIDWKQGFSVDLDHLIPMKSLSQLFCWRAIRRQVTGDPVGAWEDVGRGLRLASQWREPTLISHLVRQALTAIATDTVQKLLRHGPPPGLAAWRELDGLLLELDGSEGVTDALRGELLMLSNSLPADGSVPADSELAALGGPARAIPIVGRYERSADRLGYLGLMAKAIRATRRPPLEARDELARLGRAAGDHGELARTLAPTLPVVWDRHLNARAFVRLTRTALVLAREAGAKGLPAQPSLRLIDLTAADGRPVAWKREGPRQGRLWCVGEDGRDDGGDQNTPADAFDPDVVFELRLHTPTPTKEN